jgi:hypothetical protein
MDSLYHDHLMSTLKQMDLGSFSFDLVARMMVISKQMDLSPSRSRLHWATKLMKTWMQMDSSNLIEYSE